MTRISNRRSRSGAGIMGTGLSLALSLMAAAGTVAIYDFEDDTQDATTNANHGTVSGTATYSTDVAAVISSRSTKSFSFDGASHISLPHAGIDFYDRAQSSGASISMWVKASAQNQKTFFAEGSSASNTPIYNFQTGDSSGSTDDQARLAYRGNTSGIEIHTSTGSPFDGTWRHIVITDEGGSVSLYVDGSFDSSLNYTPSAISLNRTALGILLRASPFGNFTGLMDEVAIYGRVLTPGEIGELAGGLDPISIPDNCPQPTPLVLELTHDNADLTFTWNSEAGRLYNLKTSMNLSAATSTWHLLEGGIGATPPLNTWVTPMPDDPRRFYVLEKNSDTTFGLWSGDAIPSNHTTIPFPQDLETITLLDAADPYPYKFLHGASIINYNGTFHANWANSPVNENFQDERLVGRTFTDRADTDTWSEPEVIGSDLPGLDRRSHACYLEHDGELWTFAARFGTGDPGVRFDGLRAEGFKLNNATGEWESQGIVMTNCWPYEEPVRMGNGNYVVAGQDKDGKPVCAISQGGDLTQWDTVLLPFPSQMSYSFAETTVWAEGIEVTAVIRTRTGVAWVATSVDGGVNWAEARPSNMPMPDAKAYLGKLSTGQLYMVSNLRNRDTLVVSVGKPGESTLSSMWRIRYGSSSPIPRFSGSAKSPQWSYPYGYEHDGKLYIVYSIGKENCGLSVVPITSLATSP